MRDALIPLIGSPRDALDPSSVRVVMDCKPSDWDITTNATAKEIKRVLGGRLLSSAERRHETVLVSMDSTPIEVTPYRNGATRIEDDLEQRDFTVNAIAWDISGYPIDPFDGAQDIRAGILRAVKDPVQRFREDGLRILRGLRFASVFGWDVEPATALAMHAERELLSGIAAERIGMELAKMLCGVHVGDILRCFWDVLSDIIPEIGPTVGFQQNNPHHHLDVWKHTIAVVQATPDILMLRLAALLHDLGKPQCYTMDDEGKGHFYGHAEHSAKIAREVLTRLRFSEMVIRHVVSLVEHHSDILTDTPSRRTVRRMVSKVGADVFQDLLVLRRADIAGHQPDDFQRALEVCRRFEEIFADLKAEEACFSLKDLAVRGYDIMELGYRGPEIGMKLRELLEAVLEEKVPNERETLIHFLQDEPAQEAEAPIR